MGSSRLPGKVLMDISGKPLLEHIVDRLRLCKSLDKILIATTFLDEDIPILELSKKLNVDHFAGPVENVFQRFLDAGKAAGAETVLRVCGDSPLIDYNLLDLMINCHLKKLPDITFVGTKIPLGTGAEVIQYKSLSELSEFIEKKSHVEHVTTCFYDHPEKFKLSPSEVPDYLKEVPFRLTVDTEEDLKLIREVYKHLYRPEKILSTKQTIAFLKKNPALCKINQGIKQKD